MASSAEDLDSSSARLCFMPAHGSALLGFPLDGAASLESLLVEDHLATELDSEARCVLGEYSAQKELRQISIVGIVSSGSKTNVNSLR